MIDYLQLLKPVKFQSTHSQGVRWKWTITHFSQFLFQSTHSQGVRCVLIVQFVELVKFQSTHSQGVR